MKKILLVWAMVFAFAVVAVAQDKPIKGSFAKAQTFLEKGDLKEAKKYIDAAASDPKQTEKSRYWLVKGKVYQAISLSDDAALQTEAPNALADALASYQKVREMEKAGSLMLKELDETQGFDLNTGQIRPSIIVEFRDAFFNKGVEAYNTQNYKGAMISFERCYNIQKGDTLAALYAMTCADLAEDSESSDKYAKALIEMNYTDAKLYIQMARKAYREENWAKVVEIAKEGKAKNPADTDLVKFMIDGYIKQNKKEEAVASIQESLKNDPNDRVGWFQLGLLYDELKEYDKSEEAYKKTVEIAPDFFEAYFNFFVMYNNQIRLKDEAYNNLFDAKGKMTDEAKGKAISSEIKVLREKSVGVLEQCEKLQPSNRDVLGYLEFLYDKLYIDDKRDAVRAKLKALGEE